MTHIVKEYGQALIAAISAAMIITLLTVMFISDGGEVSLMIKDFVGRYIGFDAGSSGELALAMEGSLKKEAGDIKIRKMAKKNVAYELDDLYSYVDYELEDARIMSVTKQDGFDVTKRVCKDGRKMIFFDEGVYSVTVCMWNDRGVRSLRKMYLGVTA